MTWLGEGSWHFCNKECDDPSHPHDFRFIDLPWTGPLTKRFDMDGEYRKRDVLVMAEHCPGCGRWAHVERGNSGVDQWWKVTNCGRCGRFETTGAPVGVRFGERRAITRKLEEDE